MARYNKSGGKAGIRIRGEAAPVRDTGALKNVGFLVLLGLLVAPGWAFWKLSGGYHWLGFYFPVVSLVTYRAYVVDKRRAEGGEWRIPEFNLHLLELLGGWPGAFVAQRRVRHKISKASYQMMFWLIILGYQLAAWDSLQDWRYARAAGSYLEARATQRK